MSPGEGNLENNIQVRLERRGRMTTTSHSQTKTPQALLETLPVSTLLPGHVVTVFKTVS